MTDPEPTVVDNPKPEPEDASSEWTGVGPVFFVLLTLLAWSAAGLIGMKVGLSLPWWRLP